MDFVDRLTALLQNSKKNTALSDNGVRLLYPTRETPPLAKHYIFPPMPQAIQQKLIQSYRRPFPEELLEIYNIANGMMLFWERIPVEYEGTKLVLAHAKISVFGVPITHDRKHMEPSNIVLEDFDRMTKYPESWLKFGAATDIIENRGRAEYCLYFDTECNSVYMIDRSNHSEYGRWQSIDKCLCELYDKA